jgi:MtN3 and saliva related transmembrane protein
MMEVYAVNLVLHGSGGAFLITNTLSLVSASVMVVLILKYRKREEVC